MAEPARKLKPDHIDQASYKPERQGEVIDFQEASNRIRAQRHADKIVFQNQERYGELSEDDPRMQMIYRIQERLHAAAPNLPKGEARYLQSTNINAFVVNGIEDVFVYEGYPRQFIAWCRQNGFEPSEDTIAMIYAHELGHIRQGTEEVDVNEQENKDERKIPKREEVAKKHQKRINDEYDADRFALQLLARAGYNPREGLKMFQFFQCLSEGHDLPITHPRSPDRLRELVAMVESPDTIIPNTDKAPTALSPELLKIYESASAKRPGTAVYRAEAMGRLSEHMARVDNIHDALEVAQVAHMHGYLTEMDQVRKSKEVRTSYAKHMVLDNVRILLEAMEYRYQGRTPFGGGTLFNATVIPDNRIRYANREYGYMQPLDDEPVTGRSIDVGIAKEMDGAVNSSSRFVHSQIDKKIAEIDEKITQTRPDNYGHGELIKYRAQLVEIKSALDSEIEKIDDGTIAVMVESVNDDAKLTDWAITDSTYNWVENSTGSAMLEWCLKNGTPMFSRLLNPENDTIKDALSGVVQTDSRYQPFLDPELTAPEDMLTPSSRTQFIEQSIMMHLDGSFKWAKSRSSEVNDEFNEHTLEHVGDVVSALAAVLQKRYEVLGKASQVLAEIISEVLLAESPEIRSKLYQAIDRIPSGSAQAWFESVNPLAGDFECSAAALFISESGIGRELQRETRRNLHARLYQLEGDVSRNMRSVLNRAGDSTSSFSMDSLVKRMAIGGEHMRADALSQITKELKKSDWDTAVVADFETKLTPLLQVLNKEERLSVMNIVVGPGHVDRDKMPNITEIVTYSLEACPEYANKLLTWRWEQILALEPAAARFAFLSTVYSSGHKLDDLTRMSYGAPDKQFRNMLGKEYVTLHDQLNGEAKLADVLVMLTRGRYIESDKGNPVLADPEIQKRVDRLSNDDVLRVADAAKEAYRGEHVTGVLFNDFAADIVKRVIGMVGVTGEPPYWEDAKFKTGEYPFGETFSHIADHVVDAHRDRLLAKCQEAYQVSGADIVAQGYISRFDDVRETIMIHGTPLKHFPDKSVDRNAARYDPTAPPFQKIYLSDYSNKANAIRDHLEKTSLLTDRSRPIQSRLEAVVVLIPEQTDYRDFLLAEIEADYLNEIDARAVGHRVEASEGDISETEISTLFTFYREAIPFLTVQVQADMWGRRANMIHETYLGEPAASLENELARITGLFPAASFARDEALYKIGDSELVRNPDDVKVVQSLTTDLSRRSDKANDVLNQSALERVNVAMASLSRTEKKDFMLWLMGASDDPPKSMKAYGGIHQVSFGDVPEMVFVATAPEREELLLRMMVGTNGLLEPQEPAHEALVTEFIEAAFAEVFPEELFTDMPNESRRIIFTVFETVLTEYDSYRGAKIFIGIMESMRDDHAVNRGKRLVALMSELGPVFVKVGQVLSELEASPGVPLLPDDVREEMRSFKQGAKRFSRMAAIQSLESAGEFNEINSGRITEVGKTLAAASIKQVSDARRADGKEVVEKVLRPSIEKHLQEDIRVLSVIVGKIRQFMEVPRSVEESAATYVQEESDFEREASNTKKIGKVLARYRRRGVVRKMQTRTPEIYSFSRRHIQEEKIRGISLEELMHIYRDPNAMEAVAIKHDLTTDEQAYYAKLATDIHAVQLQAFDAMAFQYFQGDAFHGDPHGGNLLLPTEGGLAFIDDGSIGESSKSSRVNLRKFFIGFELGRTADMRAAVQSFAPDIQPADLDEIERIVQSDLGDTDKITRILKIVSESSQQLDPTFDKFLKSFGTGAYLTQGLNSSDVRLILGAYAQGETNSVSSFVAVAGARLMRENPDSRVGRLLHRYFGEAQKEPQ